MQDQTQQINQMRQELDALKLIVANHQHTQGDGTTPLRKTITLDRDQWLGIGSAEIITGNPRNQGTLTELYTCSFSSGSDPVTQGVLYKSQNIQMDFIHYPNDILSFVQFQRKPLVAATTGTSLTISAAGNTVTIPGYNFIADELAGAVIYIQNAGGTTISASTIASNTPTVVTIDGTWGATASNCVFGIYRPVYMGTAETILQRVYVQETTTGGLRFGMGATAGGRNGLLYMDAAGDLFWRDKAGTVTQLN